MRVHADEEAARKAAEETLKRWVAATHTPQLRDTLTALSTVAERALMRRYGTCANPRRGYSYHNRCHGRDVAHAPTVHFWTVRAGR